MIGARILVVEDERIVALHLRQQLTRLGYLVVGAATSGSQALKLIADQRPDIVLMDIHIEGDIDGIATAALIPAALHVPVIYLTAYSEEVTLERARGTKPYGYLLKPFSEREMHAVLQMALERRRCDLALQDSEQHLQEQVKERTKALEAANQQLLHEIEERRRVEHEIRQLNVMLDERIQSRTALLQSILDTVPDAMIVIDTRGRIESFSAAAQRLFGYTSDEILGHNISMLMPSPRREEHDSYLEHYLTTGERRVIGLGRVVTGQRRDGRTFPMELSVGEVVLGDQRLFTGFVHDLTERHESERREHELRAQVAQISRFNDMGQIAAGLAHELNQPLAATSNYLNGMRRFLERGDATSIERARATTEIALRQVQRAAQTIGRLREFVRKSEPEPKAENIHVLIQEVNDLIAFTARERDVVIRFRGDFEPPPVLVDKVQIQQVVVNLMRNAIEAMEKSKRREIAIETASAGDRLVAVAVADTGPGIAKDIVDRLFQPFTTTKTQGLGVGLSLCRSIIEAHGGRLWAEPNPEGGTVFRFTVPAARLTADLRAG
jgi:two-component system sensor kinase FixL